MMLLATITYIVIGSVLLFVTRRLSVRSAAAEQRAICRLAAFIANRSGDSPTALVCIGVGGMMLFQTIENIGMCIGLMPIIGLTLPFFSYGGSSVLTIFLAVALVSAAKMHASKRRY